MKRKTFWGGWPEMPWKKKEMNIWPDPTFEGWGEDVEIDDTYPEWVEDEKTEKNE